MSSRRRISTIDMTEREQLHVRNALYLLRSKFGTWRDLARCLKYDETTVIKCATGSRTVMASMAFRVARLADVPIDELLSGRYPLRGCPRCGYRPPRPGPAAPSQLGPAANDNKNDNHDK